MGNWCCGAGELGNWCEKWGNNPGWLGMGLGTRDRELITPVEGCDVQQKNLLKFG